MRRRTALVLGSVVLLSGCARDVIGRTVPACDPDQVGSTVILEAQSVPDVEYVPCINDLKAGWTYEHLKAESGEARFWISSDRVGERFLEVRLQPACEIGDAAQVESDEGSVPLFVDVENSDYILSLVVIPEGADVGNRTYALELAVDLGSEVVEDRTVRVWVDASDDATQDRITRALEGGAPVLVVGPREREENLVELYLVDEEGAVQEPQRLSLGDALEEIEETLDEPSYEARWHYLFRSGCVTYTFDAHGPGIESLPREVQAALGLYPVDPLRELGAEYGYVVR
jgi:hypothetical protein